ncbi:MAG: von Willebrand factor type protein, partial [Myxococcaceae bacterium]|nr:von Willebrand factor type protein [Myxococcaceae bacterium]
MNRTGIFLAAAGVLALIALVAGLPRVVRSTTVEVPIVTPPATSGSGSLKMTGRLSHPFVGLGRSDVFLTVDLSAVDVAGAARAPLNLALVIDRSGSMSGFKLTQAKQAAKQLVSQLTANDRLSIVHYGSDVKSMAGTFATTENKERMLSYLEGIWDDGGTNIGAGLSTGRDLLLAARSDFKVNRMILISDGQPTEGLTDANGLNAIVRETRQQGISVSSIGV